MNAPTCEHCAHWADDRALLEERIPGLASFGSAYGASVGTSRLCLHHDRLTMPRDRCIAFVALVAFVACDALQKSFVVKPSPPAWIRCIEVSQREVQS